jgi:hypothetical protein
MQKGISHEKTSNMDIKANLQFKDINDFMKSVLEKQVTFSNEKSTRLIVNAVIETLIDSDTRPEDFKAFGSAEDIDDWFWESWADGFDWYDVFMFTFDAKSIAGALSTSGDLSSHYSTNEITELLEDTLMAWSNKVRRFVFDELAK